MTASRAYLSVLATSILLIGHRDTSNSNNPKLLLCNAQLLPDEPEYLDFYCGFDWVEANANCEFPCPSGSDEDCPPMPNGRKRKCLAATNCHAKFRKVYWTGVVSLEMDKEMLASNVAVVTTNNMTNTTPTTVDGIATTTEPPEDVEDESEAEDLPTGPSIMMEDDENSFERSFRRYLYYQLEEMITILEVSVKDQEYNRPEVAAANGADSSTSTYLDMIVQVVGEYMPVGDKVITEEQLGDEVLTNIDTDANSIVNAIKSNSTSFFDAMTGILAVNEEDVVESPSASPSMPPSRGFDQSLDLRIDPRPTGSYGIVFNVKTPKEMPTVLITAMSFVTLYEGRLEYEVWSKVGPYDKFIGRNTFWELVASGQTMGQGSKAYTPILLEDTTTATDPVDGKKIEYVGFKPLHVPGDRGQRSFYVTLTKRFEQEDGSVIPILFSYPIDDNEGERKYAMIDSSPELEVYEGDATLTFPWSQYTDGPTFRRPRGFIGNFEYDRYPCHPLLNFTGWPCPFIPDIPEAAPPTAKPTVRPTAPSITRSPTKRPTKNPTDSPTTKPVALIEAETEGSDESENITDYEFTVSIAVDDEEETNNGVKSWKIAYRRSFGCESLAMLVMMHLV